MKHTKNTNEQPLTEFSCVSWFPIAHFRFPLQSALPFLLQNELGSSALFARPGRIDDNWDSRRRAVQDTEQKMVTAPDQVVFIDEVAAFLASEPSRDEILAYRPSEAVERRFEVLLEKQRSAPLTDDERAELHQFQQTEILLRLLKARLRAVATGN